MINFGLDKNTQDAILNILRKYTSIKKAIIFGSRAKNTYKAGSDVDLAIWYDGDDASFIGKLSSDLEDSTIPYFFDLVDYKHIANDKLRNAIDNEGKVFYLRGWEVKKLGDVVAISSSKRIFAKEYHNYGVPFYRGKEIIEKQLNNDISTKIFITKERFLEIKSKFGAPKSSDMLLTSVGTIGIPYIVNNHEEFYFKDGNLTWFKDWNLLHNIFFYYWVLSDIGKNAIRNITIGSTQQAVTINALAGINLNLPPLPEQKQIASILSSLDNKIELLNKQNKTLEELAQTIFKQWFIDFNFPDENGKPYKDSGGKMVDSELGLIPIDWCVGKLADEFLIIMGQSPVGTSYNETKNGIVFFQGRTDFGGRFPCVRLYTTEPKRIANKFDVLLSVRAPVGDINLALVDCCIGRGLASIQSKNRSYCYYKVLALKNELNIFNGTGTIFGAINKDQLTNLKIILPDNKIIEDFESIVSAIDSKIYNNHVEAINLQQIRDSLLPHLMSGEIDLN